MVSKLNSLQGKIDEVDARQKELEEAKQLATAKTSENETLRKLVKKKMHEVSEMKTKQEAEIKALTEKHQAEILSYQ